MARIVVAGSGAMGASVAYHLALLGADDVVVAERGELCSGSTSRAMGGVRQQFSTAEEVVLARESIGFLVSLGAQFFRQVGYLFLATTPEGLAELEERRVLQTTLGVAVERVDPTVVRGLATADVLGATCCWSDGLADPPSVAREVLRRAAELGVDVREHVAAETLEADVLVIAAGPWSAALASTVGVELPIRPLCRQLLETSPLNDLPEALPMIVEAETGFHFRRRGDRLVLAMNDAEPRWTFNPFVDESVIPDRLEHAACGFSGHGFMQSPAVGRALAELIVSGESSLDLSPYALERFESGASFPEHLVL